MAVYDMQGKWNLRIRSIDIDGKKFNFFIIYFDLADELHSGDELFFGTWHDFILDYQIRANAMGASNYTTVQSIAEWHMSSVSPPPGYIYFLPKTITSTMEGVSIQLKQETYNYQWSQTISNHLTRVTLKADNDFLSIGNKEPDYGGNSSQLWTSPVTLLYNDHNKKFLRIQDAYFPVFYTSELELLYNLRSLNGFSGYTGIPPIPYDANTNGVYVSFRSYLGADIIDPTPPGPDMPDSDPYAPNAFPDGGDGETQQPDSVEDPALPTVSVVSTGFVTLYKPSTSQLNSLASYMWGTLDLSLFKKIFSDPMDAILGLSILPGIVESGSSGNVLIGNIDTGVSMTKVANQYVKFNCGSLEIKKKWGAFLDYSPYTRGYLYLPFIGIKPIEIDDIMGKTVQIKYNIDVLSGACCAFILAGGTTLYSYTGQCACSVPVTGRDWTNLINGVLGSVSSAGLAIGSVASGNLPGAVAGIASIAQNVIGSKPTIEHSGAMGGMGGLLGIKRPFIIIERPRQAVPGYQNHVIGYPAFVFKYISQLSGYTEFENIHLDIIPCLQEELTEIEDILKSGVII